jgi:iron complex transport system permease protein
MAQATAPWARRRVERGVVRAVPPPSRHPARLPGRWLAGAVLAGIAALAVATAFGPVGLPLSDVLGVMVDRLPLLDVGTRLDATESAIVTEVRLPRAVLAFVVGGLLAAAGAAYQGVFRNPLADPYLLGAASGAGLGATVAIVGTGTVLGGVSGTVPAAAFVGALGAVGLAYALGAGADRLRSTASLLLAGVAVGSLCAAVQTFVLQRDDEAVRDVYAWLLGRLNVAGWDEIALVAPYGLVSVVVLLALAGRLDVLAVGDEEAAALGVRPGRVRLVVVVAATLGTAAAVAVSGLVGFVGIIVPHAVRLRCGPGYRRILPLSTLYGGAFLCLADLIARSALAPAEIPIGVITALVGAPFFLLVLRRSRAVAT